MSIVEKNPHVVVSNDIFVISHALAEQVRSYQTATIIVPDATVRTWLLHDLTERAIPTLRIEVLTPKEVLGFLYEDPLTTAHLLPLLTQFFASRNEERGARTHLLSFALQAFLGQKTVEDNLWKEFVQFCPFKILSEHAPIKNSLNGILFGFTSIHPLLLSRYVESIPLHTLYLLSPCMLYWEDLLSDAETRKLTASRGAHIVKEFEKLSSDRQTILANLGQLGRNFFQTMNDLPTEALYSLPKCLMEHQDYHDLVHHDLIPTNKQASLLEYLKADLLLLVGKHEPPISLSKDLSIELHGAYTPLREVEALKDYLFRLFGKHAIPPASVMVLVQDLNVYAPCFEQVFGSDDISYSIIGTSSPQGPIAVMKLLLELVESKSKASDWAEVVRHPVFSTALNLSEDEKTIVSEWLSTCGCWGIHETFCASYLASRAIIGKEQGIIESATSQISESVVEGVAIGKFLRFLEKIPLSFGTETLYLQQYAKLFTYLSEFLAASDSESIVLCSSSSTFQKITDLSPTATLTFAEAKKLFLSLVMEALPLRIFDLRSHIYVAEIRDAQPFPADVVALLGMQEAEFPKNSRDLIFSKIHKLSDNIPLNNIFFDRYAFIESIMAAKHLFIGYQAYAFATKEEAEASSVVSSLFSHLDSNYLIDGQTPSKILHTLHQLARPLSPQTPRPNTIAPIIHTPRPDSFDVYDLKFSARSPLALYFKERFGITRNSSEQLFAPQWKLKILLEENIGASPPEDSFEYRALEKETIRALHAMGLSSLDRCDLHILPTVVKPYQEGKNLFVPATPSQNVVGSWPNMLQQGLLITDSEWKKELFYRWPEYVVRSYLANQNLPVQPVVLVTHKESKMEFPNCAHLLPSWIDFGRRAKTTPLPFSYDTVKLLHDNAPPEALYDAIVDNAAKKAEAWQVFASILKPHECAENYSNWQNIAKTLWPEEIFS